MKRIPLLCIDSVDDSRPLLVLAPLLEAFDAAGLRWAHLVWRPSESPSASSAAPSAAVAGEAEEALAAGGHKAVRIEAGRSVATKALAGPPVFRDVLREHFRGQGVVLIEGELPADIPAPRIEATSEGRFLVTTEKSARSFDVQQVIAELRRARPFDSE